MKNLLIGLLLVFVMVTTRRAALVPIRCDDGCVVPLCITPRDAIYDVETETYSWYTESDGWCVSPYGPHDPEVDRIQKLQATVCSGCSE